MLARGRNRGHRRTDPPFRTAADSFGAGQRMRTYQDDPRAIPLRSRCNVQVSPGHVVTRRRPGYGPGMSRARVSTRSAIMRQYQLTRWRGDGSPAWNAGPDPAGRPSAAVNHPERWRLMSSQTENRPFRVGMPDEAIADLRRRTAATRWPSKELVADRSQGVQLATIQELVSYWATDYDWRKAEAKLNALPQFTTEIDGANIHFIHVKSEHENALPLIMTHGWPGSVVELLETVGPLTDPTAHGGSAEDAFHLVLPSLPGYGLSSEPVEVGWDLGRTARAWAELTRRLGYTRYVAQGGDVGAAVTDAMGLWWLLGTSVR